MRVRSSIHTIAVLSAAAALSALTVLQPPPPLHAAPVRIQRISVGVTGEAANDWSGVATISGDGRFVAFESPATNLIRGDTNGHKDIFVRDVQTSTTERVSVTASGVQANNYSMNAVISNSGRYVAFHSLASNLASNDTNGAWDVFVKDRQTGSLDRVSVSATNVGGNGSSSFPAISADGRYVAFQSNATNLVPNDTSSGTGIFVKDRHTGLVEQVSPAGQHPAISADGRLVLFGPLLHDRQTHTTTRYDTSASGTPGNGDSGAGDFSGNSRYLAFWSNATNLVPNDTNGTSDVFVKNRATGALDLISTGLSGAQADGSSEIPDINLDGRFVAFISHAANLVQGDTNGKGDAFVRDRQTGAIERISVAANGTQANGLSDWPHISDDGRFVVISSAASNLAPPFSNETFDDVFLVDRSVPITP